MRWTSSKVNELQSLPLHTENKVARRARLFNLHWVLCTTTEIQTDFGDFKHCTKKFLQLRICNPQSIYRIALCSSMSMNMQWFWCILVVTWQLLLLHMLEGRAVMATMNLLSFFFAMCDLMWYYISNHRVSSEWRMFCSFVFFEICLSPIVTTLHQIIMHKRQYIAQGKDVCVYGVVCMPVCIVRVYFVITCQ